MKKRDVAAIGRACTQSAIINQDVLPKKHLTEMLQIVDDFSLPGVMVSHTGTYNSGLMAGMILGSTLFGLAAGKWRVKPIAIFGFLACSFVLFSFIFIKGWQLTIVTVFLLGTLMAFIDSAMDSWLLEIVPENGRVAIFTTVTSLFTIAAPLGTSLFGSVYHAAGVSLAFCLMALVILVGVFFSLRIQED